MTGRDYLLVFAMINWAVSIGYEYFGKEKNRKIKAVKYRQGAILCFVAYIAIGT